jgi:hypothetical protein
MQGELFFHIIWVSGKRMIAQGTDRPSRGDLSSRVMQGRPMLDFVPLHLSAFDRSPHLRTWMESFCSSVLERSAHLDGIILL